MSDAVALRTEAARHVANLRCIPQRVAQLAQFDTTVNLKKTSVRMTRRQETRSCTWSL